MLPTTRPGAVLDEKFATSKSRPRSVRSASQEHGTIEPIDLDLTGFLRHEVGNMSVAERDEAAMRAMGRRQLLDRNFGYLSMIGFTTTMMANWEAEALSISAGLLNGGSEALVFGYILVFFGTLATAYSLGELASMYPTAGGQYHFVALLAPRKIKNVLSFLAGYISILAWQATTASCAFLAATVTQGLLSLNYTAYEFERWHGTMIFILIIIIAALFNSSLARSLPFIEGAVILLHICGYFVVLIPLIMFGPKSSANTVFTTSENRGGWSSGGLSWSIGLISSAYPFLCYDGSCHMSEEVEDAAITVPRSMVATVLLNGGMGFGMLLAILFSMGNIEDALATKTGYPIIEIVYNALEDKVATSAVISIMIAMFVFATIGIMASTSRLTWAFARDKGLPFSEFLSRIHPRFKLPLNAIILTAAINFLLALVNIASVTAFHAMLSLAVISLYLTYITPIILILHLRWKYPNSIGWGPFRMGRIGATVNIISILYTAYACIFLVFPPYAATNSENMNWTVLVCGATVIGAACAWFLGGSKRYKGPLKEI